MRAVLTILAIWCAGLGAAAQFGKISVLFDDLTAIYAGHSAVEIGFLLSVVGVVGIVFGTTAALLVARIGPRRGIVLALLAGAMISIVQTTFPPFPIFLASRLIEGLSHLFIVVIGPGVIAGLANARWQGAAMTLWSSFFGLAYAAMFMFVPALVVSEGPAAVFWLHGIWMGVMALFLWVLLSKDPAFSDQETGPGLIARNLSIYASPYIAAPATGFFCYTVTYVALLTLLPGQMGADGLWVGVAMPLVSIAVSLSIGVALLRWISAVNAVQIGFGVAVLAALALGLTLGGSGAVWSSLALSAGLGIVQGASFAALAQLNPTAQTRASAAGAIAQLGNIGTTCGTPMLAFLIAQTGMPGVVGFVVGFSALGMGLHLWQAKRRKGGIPAR